MKDEGRAFVVYAQQKGYYWEVRFKDEQEEYGEEY